MTEAWSEEMEWDTEVDFIRCMVTRCMQQQPVQDVAFVMGGHESIIIITDRFYIDLSRLHKVHAWSSDVYNYRQSRMWPFSHRCGIYKVVIRCVQLQTVQDVAFLTPMWYIQGGYQMCTTTDSPGLYTSDNHLVYTTSV